MAAKQLAAALQRLESILLRRPSTGLTPDAPATARWHGGAEVITSHVDGMRVVTDLPKALGGGGLLGMLDETGAPVSAGPRDVRLSVRISAPGVSIERLRRLVEMSHRSSPVSSALQETVPVSVRVEDIAADAG